MTREPEYGSYKERREWALACAAHPHLTDKEKLVGVLLIMAYYSDYSGQCNPAVPTLAGNTLSTDRWIRRTLAKYKALGMIDYEANKGGFDHRTGKGITNNYQYVMPPWPTLSPQTGSNPVQPDRVKPPTLSGQTTNPVQPSHPTLSGGATSPCPPRQPNTSRTLKENTSYEHRAIRSANGHDAHEEKALREGKEGRKRTSERKPAARPQPEPTLDPWQRILKRVRVGTDDRASQVMAERLSRTTFYGIVRGTAMLMSPNEDDAAYINGSAAVFVQAFQQELRNATIYKVHAIVVANPNPH